MELNNIHELVQRYWDGESSLQEERFLKDYFNQTEIKPELEKYRDYFSYLSVHSKTTLSDSFSFKKPMRRIGFKMQAAAAIVLLVACLFFYHNPMESEQVAQTTYEDTFQTPEEALSKLKEALVKVSISMDQSQKIAKGNIKKIDKALLIIK